MTSQPSPQSPRNTGRRVASILSGVAVTLGAVVAAGATAGGAAADHPPPLPPQMQTIRYQVTGPGAAEYVNYEMDYQQQYEPNVPLPWAKQFSSPLHHVHVLSAQGQSSISCAILVDGNVVSQMTATGSPARAACSH